MSTRYGCFTQEQTGAFESFYHPFFTFVQGLDLPDKAMRLDKRFTVDMKKMYTAAWELSTQKFPDAINVYRMDYKEFKYIVHNLVEPMWSLQKLNVHSKLSGDGLIYLVLSRIKNERGSLERAMKSVDISGTGGRPVRIFDKILANATEEEKEAALLADKEEMEKEPTSASRKRRASLPPLPENSQDDKNVPNKRPKESNDNNDGQDEKKEAEGAASVETETPPKKEAKNEEDYVELKEQLKGLQQQHKILRKKHKTLKRKYAKLKFGEGKQKTSGTAKRRAASKK